VHIPRAPVPTSELISLEFGTGLDSICFGFSRHLPGIWTYQVYKYCTQAHPDIMAWWIVYNRDPPPYRRKKYDKKAHPDIMAWWIQ
jgi:hypothetical protein